MLTKNVEWYIEHLDQISAFEAWIQKVKSDVPKQISSVIKRAANAAIVDLAAKGETESDYLLNSEGTETYWWLSGSYDDEEGLGVFISAWIPSSVGWLTNESDELPSLNLCYNTANKRKIKEQGRQVSRLVRELPFKCRRIETEEQETFICVRRELDDCLNGEGLRKENLNKLQTDLTQIFVEFTKAVRSALGYGRTMSSRPD